MDVVETDDLQLLYFDPFQTYLVPHVANNFHNSLEFQKRIFGWQPNGKTTILLTDFSDYGNAGAGVIPHNMLSVYIAPMSRTLETMPASERMFMLMNHEPVHLANMDAANEDDLRWRRFFRGKPQQTARHPESILYNYLTAPRFNVPRWYTEGAAVFMETWMSGGLGRAQGAYDEMVFRAMVRDDAHFYSSLGIVAEGSSVDFQTGVNAYLYGTRFFSYLALEYSPEQVVQWLRRDEDSEAYFTRQFQKVFGKSLDDAWDDWIAFEKQWQTRNLAAVRKYPLTPAQPITPSALGSISRSYIDSDGKTMVGAFRYPGVVAHVGKLSLDDGELEKVVDIKGAMKYRVASTAFDPDQRRLFYSADHYAFRDLMAVELETGKSRMLIKDARVGDIVHNPADKSLWGLRHLNGYVSLVRIAPPHEEWTLVHAFAYGEVPSELDISADGTLLSASVAEVDGGQYLRVFKTEDLLAGKLEAVQQFDFGTAVPEGFVFSPDGRYLYGSSYYTGVSNIFRFELATGAVEAVSNAETGFFRPIPLEDGSLLVFEFTGQGFVPVKIDPKPLEDVSAISFLGNEIVREHPVVKDWNVVASLDEVDYTENIVREGKYRPYREMRMDYWMPVIEGYQNSTALGANVRFSDPAHLYSLDVTTSYSTGADEDFHIDIEFDALYWSARYWHNNADFYDLFGPVDRSRKGDAFIIGYDRALIFDDPRKLEFSAEIAQFLNLETLPGNQNVDTLFFQDITSAEAELSYTDTRRSLGSVDHEKGFRWDLVAAADYADNDTVPRARAGLDFGFALPWKHSSFWFYNSLGYADGDRLNPLTNFYFGSFGNNYVDSREVKRYRNFDSFPGFNIDDISAREYGKSMLEFNIPPWRFKNAGTPSLYLNHIRPALFAGALHTDPGEDFDETWYSVGVQLDLEFKLMHRLPMTLTVGYAEGYRDSDKVADEWMLSLKIM
ncbi:MAG: hypothetical protein ABJ308_00280 [Halieaceae bacterium]